MVQDIESFAAHQQALTFADSEGAAQAHVDIEVVRSFQQPNGKLMVGLQNTQSRFRSIAPGSWPEGAGTATIQ